MEEQNEGTKMEEKWKKNILPTLQTFCMKQEF